MIDKLYKDYYNKLLWYCISLSRSNTSIAEDIVQETFMRALENAHILNDLTESQCCSWLYRTAKNIFIDKVRRMANEPMIEEPLFKEDDLSKILVSQLCARLPEKERALFWMRYIEGYTSTELGEMFNLPSSTIRSRLSSARKKMSKIYFMQKGKGD
ncbi:RNA polymerase sigma factor [Anaerosalibacter sp. Marseille-P3206]|uniref:RNA polymerase sigma factor n=1 Tax=Anaerosalibacter sp. Marseille-P3206 TaxID=1871005 RepID=UPI000984F13D|nr:sigma-70 family RNA polymerase sigma factor [Anaerosalibacter sp. Marseille-P3206]